MNTETTVKYTKDKAVITMHLDKYERLCQNFNGLVCAMGSVHDLWDFSLRDVHAMDELKWTLQFDLGFEKIENDSYHSQYRIPKGSK
jgi:hypothetical protein